MFSNAGQHAAEVAAGQQAVELDRATAAGDCGISTGQGRAVESAPPSVDAEFRNGCSEMGMESRFQRPVSKRLDESDSHDKKRRF